MLNSFENTLITKAKIILPLLLAVFFITPLGIVLLNIFQRAITHPEELLYFLSLSFLKKLYNSSILSITVSVTSVIFGSLIAFIYFTLKSKWQRTGILFLSLFIFTVSPVIYLVALTRYQFFTLLPVFLQSVSVLTLSLSPLPFAILVLTFGTITKSSLDVAFLSASPGQVYKKIILTQQFFPLAISGLIIFMLVFKHQEVPSFLGYRTYSEEFLNRIIVMSDSQQVSIYSLPFLIIGFFIVMFLLWMISKSHLYNIVENFYQPLSFTFRKKKMLLLASILMALIFPVIFHKIIVLKDISLFFSTILENYKHIENSLSLAVTSAVIGTMLSCYLFNFFKRFNSQAISMVGFSAFLFYWLLPSSLTTLGIIEIVQFFQVNSKILDILVLLFGYQTNLLPIAIFVLCAVQIVRKEQDNTILQCLEISNLNIFTKIILPLNWPIWLLIATILSVFVLNELSITVLLIPPGMETIVIKIYNLMHYGDFSLVGILSLIQIVLVSIFVLITAGVVIKKKY